MHNLLMSFLLSVFHSQGVICAVPLVFILPAASYIRLAEGPWYAKNKIPSIAIAMLGVLVTVFGFVTLFIDTSLTTCKEAAALPYCTKDLEDLNATALPISPTEPPFVPSTTPLL